MQRWCSGWVVTLGVIEDEWILAILAGFEHGIRFRMQISAQCLV